MNGDRGDSYGTGSHVLLSLGACSSRERGREGKRRGEERRRGRRKRKHQHNIPLEQSPRRPCREEEPIPSKPPSTTK